MRIPFTDGGAGEGLMPGAWNAIDVVLLRLETEDGYVGWGESFSYFLRKTVVSALEEMILPHVVGATVEDIPTFTRTIQQRVHLFGRYGITMFAISGLDIALWDLQAKRQNARVAELIGGVKRNNFPVYASLVRYGDPALVEKFARKAVDEGYPAVKMHEITLEAITAGRKGAGDVPLSTDVNCNWSMQQTVDILPTLKELDLYWVEEPVFPPDNERVLGDLQQRFGVPIASGENACTSVEFARIAPSIKYLQPSVTKVGGITEFIECCNVIEKAGAITMPHCPYFGPGYWASAHLMAARPETGMFEFLYIEPDTWLDPDIPLARDGMITLPDKPGIGFEPDLEILERFRID